MKFFSLPNLCTFSLFLFFSLLAIKFPLSFLHTDDWTHLTRIKHSIFGSEKITYMQEENPLNYYWLYHITVKFFSLFFGEIYSLLLIKILLSSIILYVMTKKIPTYISLSIFLIFFHRIMTQSGRQITILLLMVTILISLNLLEKEKIDGMKKNIFFTFLNQFIWSNTHLFWIYGPLTYLISLFISRRKEFILFFAVSIISSLLTPYSIRTLKYIFEIVLGERPEVQIIDVWPLKRIFSWYMENFPIILWPFLFFPFIIQLLFQPIITLFDRKKIILIILPILVFFVSVRFIDLSLSTLLINKFKKSKFFYFLLTIINIFSIYAISNHLNLQKIENEKMIEAVKNIPENCGKVIFTNISAVSYFHFPKHIAFTDLNTHWNKKEGTTIFMQPLHMAIEKAKEEGIKCALLTKTLQENWKIIYQNELYILAILE